MAIEKMKVVNIIGKYEMLDMTIEAYLDSGCFQPEASTQLIGDIKGFANINDENPYAVRFNRLSEILSISGVSLDNISNPGPKLSENEINKKLDTLEERLGALQKQRASLSEEISNIQYSIESLAHFLNLDYNLDEVFKSKFIKVRFGRLPSESFEKLSFYNSNPYVLFFPCSEQDNYLWGMYVAPVDAEDEVDNIFSSLYFERLRIPNASGTPKEAVEELGKNLEICTKRLNELDEIINEFNQLEMDDYKNLYAMLKRSFDAFEIRRYGAKYGDTFMLVGWIPESKQEYFQNCLKNVGAIEISFNNAEDSKIKPPIKLKNNKLFRPFEYFVEMFGVPGYDEIDPTSFIAITYTLLYGIMFADVGQGLLLSLIGWMMYKYKKMELGRILIPCGFAGATFGLIFGSVFGYEHALDPLFKALGFSEKPIHVTEDINLLLMFAIAIGVILMITAILINIYADCKRKNFGEALFGENGFIGLLIYVSIILIACSVFLPALASYMTLVAIFGLLIPLVLLLFKEPLIDKVNGHKFETASMGEYLMQSFFEVFEAFISYITNTVSFLRVGAFVIIHAGLMMVFFQIAEMVGGDTSVPGIIVIIFGNIIVLVLEGLLVGIQSLRLNFYEMFNRFFSGSGKPYEPITLNSANDKN